MDSYSLRYHEYARDVTISLLLFAEFSNANETNKLTEQNRHSRMIEFLYDDFAIGAVLRIPRSEGLRLIGPSPGTHVVSPTKSDSPPGGIIADGVVSFWRWTRVPLQYARIAKSRVEKRSYKLQRQNRPTDLNEPRLAGYAAVQCQCRHAEDEGVRDEKQHRPERSEYQLNFALAH